MNNLSVFTVYNHPEKGKIFIKTQTDPDSNFDDKKTGRLFPEYLAPLSLGAEEILNKPYPLKIVPGVMDESEVPNGHAAIIIAPMYGMTAIGFDRHTNKPYLRTQKYDLERYGIPCMVSSAYVNGRYERKIYPIFRKAKQKERWIKVLKELRVHFKENFDEIVEQITDTWPLIAKYEASEENEEEKDLLLTELAESI